MDISQLLNDPSHASNANTTPHGNLDLDAMCLRKGSDNSEHALGDLHLHARNPSNCESYPSQHAVSKRRASSTPHKPLREDRSSVSTLFGNNKAGPRHSAVYLPTRTAPHALAPPRQSSFSSAPFLERRQDASLPSPCGTVSNATSYHSDWHSPPSHPAISWALYVASTSSRTTSGGCLTYTHSIYICECCPKKPKKFNTKEELQRHESEQWYICATCTKSFKNKNEANRHWKSVHLRQHSWSCAALTVETAFHASPTGRETNLCGFCGREFSNPPQWDVCAEHLHDIHKFGECNQSKKFFRADHFRQHLKHSHAGISGKWTNMLENACIREETSFKKRSAAEFDMCSPRGDVSSEGH